MFRQGSRGQGWVVEGQVQDVLCFYPLLDQSLDKLLNQRCLAHPPAADNHFDLPSAAQGRKSLKVFKPVNA